MLWENFVPAMQSPGYYDAMRNLWGYDIRDRLEEIEVPTLIVWGRNDRVVPSPQPSPTRSGSATTPSWSSSTTAATSRRSSGRCASTGCSRDFLAARATLD